MNRAAMQPHAGFDRPLMRVQTGEFPGLHTHERAIEAGMRLHGCTVHFVRAQMASGPIIGQAAVPIALDDTPDTLSKRVLTAEHQLYPLALALVASGLASVEHERLV